MRGRKLSLSQAEGVRRLKNKWFEDRQGSGMWPEFWWHAMAIHMDSI